MLHLNGCSNKNSSTNVMNSIPPLTINFYFFSNIYFNTMSVLYFILRRLRNLETS